MRSGRPGVWMPWSHDVRHAPPVSDLLELGASCPPELAVTGLFELGSGEQRGAGHLLEHIGMIERDLEVGPREQRMLAAEAFGAGALAALDRIEQTEVVAVSQQQDVARLRQQRLRHH